MVVLQDSIESTTQLHCYLSFWIELQRKTVRHDFGADFREFRQHAQQWRGKH